MVSKNSQTNCILFLLHFLITLSIKINYTPELTNQKKVSYLGVVTLAQNTSTVAQSLDSFYCSPKQPKTQLWSKVRHLFSCLLYLFQSRAAPLSPLAHSLSFRCIICLLHLYVYLFNLMFQNAFWFWFIYFNLLF
jgi:hypothetical protein